MRAQAARARSQVRVPGARPRTLQLGAFLLSPGARREVHASRFNFSGLREDRAPLYQARALCALVLLAQLFAGAQGGRLSMAQEENAFEVPAFDPKFAPKPSIFS